MVPDRYCQVQCHVLGREPGCQLLNLIPDEPVWIEARAALLDPECRLFGDSRGFVVRSDSLRLAAVAGDASESLIREAT